MFPTTFKIKAITILIENRRQSNLCLVCFKTAKPEYNLFHFTSSDVKGYLIDIDV